MSLRLSCRVLKGINQQILAIKKKKVSWRESRSKERKGGKGRQTADIWIKLGGWKWVMRHGRICSLLFAVHHSSLLLNGLLPGAGWEDGVREREREEEGREGKRKEGNGREGKGKGRDDGEGREGKPVFVQIESYAI